MIKLARFLPFLGWFPLRGDTAKADFLAGITVALVLIPQSMAYAQLAGLPPYFGLYAAFLPVAIASLFGSSAFLSTGPVAVVSLLTASALTPLAAPGSPQFIALAILLALLVGVTQLVLGLFKLGVVVNFLSHPVIVGFTNAAALIIGLSQISKLFGVPMGRSESFMHDIAGVFAQIGDTHWPTLGMGLLALGLMWGIKKYQRKWPGVLIAVALTTTLSWAIGFEKNLEGQADQIADPTLTGLVADLGKAQREESRLAETKASLMVALKEARRDALRAGEAARLGYELDLATIATTEAEGLTASLKKALRQVPVARVIDAQGATLGLYRLDQVPAGARTDGAHYSIRGVKGEDFKLVGGGEVVGRIPEGVPELALPSLSLDAIGSLLTAAIVISLVGFMEAISIAKALATKAKQKVDPNQELIGQGLANILGGFSQAFPASGSFSRSAVNFDAGARSGLSSVFTALFVLITLLFLTPLLYHLPQAVLAAIIIMAVIGLVNIEAVKHAWEASRHDGIAAIVTF
ncbi:MAG: sodium-independent anion transporter, partial [Chromatiaceae bacterium]|nr:sodium-independent anion transporter [Chromatiaceae bacterium]